MSTLKYKGMRITVNKRGVFTGLRSQYLVHLGTTQTNTERLGIFRISFWFNIQYVFLAHACNLEKLNPNINWIPLDLNRIRKLAYLLGRARRGPLEPPALSGLSGSSSHARSRQSRLPRAVLYPVNPGTNASDLFTSDNDWLLNVFSITFSHLDKELGVT